MMINIELQWINWWIEYVLLSAALAVLFQTVDPLILLYLSILMFLIKERERRLNRSSFIWVQAIYIALLSQLMGAFYPFGEFFYWILASASLQQYFLKRLFSENTVPYAYC